MTNVYDNINMLLNSYVFNNFPFPSQIKTDLN